MKRCTHPVTQLLLRMPSNNSTQCHGRVQGGYLGMLLFSHSLQQRFSSFILNRMQTVLHHQVNKLLRSNMCLSQTPLFGCIEQNLQIMACLASQAIQLVASQLQLTSQTFNILQINMKNVSIKLLNRAANDTF